MKKKTRTNRHYSAEFKIRAILDMRNNYLGYNETARKYWNVQTGAEAQRYTKRLKLWERIYLEEGEVGLMKEKRGSKSVGRVPKTALSPDIKRDLIEENQQLRMEIEYIKKIERLSSSQRASKKEQTEVISELRHKYPLEKLLALGKMSRSTFYYQLKRKKKPDKYREVKEHIRCIYSITKDVMGIAGYILF